MDVKKLVGQMTLEEKARMLSGLDMWHLSGVERLGIESVMVTDGPHGLRKQLNTGDHLGINDSVPATCFPTAAALSCSFDREMVREVGRALGEECQSENVAVILGPGANIKRSPLCGRNFEYFSEDPCLSGEMAAAHIQGVQSQDVGVSLKHFAANNQEYRRNTTDARIDERTLREIYLASFERAVKKAKPWTMMCSYNKINGAYSCQNKWLLSDVLRDEWGFDGYVMTDWGAMDDKIASVRAGLELQMPGGDPRAPQLVVEAVKSGELDEALVDRAVERILNITCRYLEKRRAGYKADMQAHDALARRVAARCCVLLKNQDDLLPLSGDMKIAFIGEMADKMRYQGSGSSHINPYRLTNALDAAAEYAQVTYCPGYVTDRDETVEELLNQAVQAAAEAGVAVIFAGLPDAFESEGFDRSHMRMPENQIELIRRVCEVQKNVVVALSGGSPVEMPWLDQVSAVVMGYLGGQAAGAGMVDVLFGAVNPGGRLAETFPIKLSDNPSYLNFPGDNHTVEYREGIFVGYRYYDKKQMDVRFPFGYGLSYTRFEYSNLRLSCQSMRSSQSLSVSVDVKNAGFIAGDEVVQLYVAPDTHGVNRPVRELRNFERITLAPGETRTVRFELCPRDFAYYETRIHDWYVEGGVYNIQIRKNAAEGILSAPVRVEAERALPVTYSMDTTLSELLENPVGGEFFKKLFSEMMPMAGGDEENARLMLVLMGGSRLSTLISFAGGNAPMEPIEEMLARMNRAR